MEKFVTFLGCLVITLAAAVCLSAMLAFPVKWLWNGTIVPLFNAPVVTFWQAWGMAVLCGLLFKAYSLNTK